MDPVNSKALKGKFKDRADKDIDNDGDVDSSDEYLHKRRKAVSKAIGKIKESAEALDEVSTSTLQRYKTKAGKDIDFYNDEKIVNKRSKGYAMASKKLTNRIMKKEEVELDLSDFTVEELEDFMMSESDEYHKKHVEHGLKLYRKAKKEGALNSEAEGHVAYTAQKKFGYTRDKAKKFASHIDNLDSALAYASGPRSSLDRENMHGAIRRAHGLTKEEVELDEAEMSLYDKIKAARANPLPDKPVRGRGSKNRNPKTYDRHTALDKEDDRIQATIKKRLKKEEKE